MSVHDAAQTVVLITGCSKGGMGYAQAEEFARYGRCKVYATARKPERMEGLDQMGCTCLRLDIADADNVKQVVDDVMRREGHIDVLVNNAGSAARGAVLDMSLDAMKKLFEVNFYGQISMMQAVGPHMIRQRSGTILNIGSMAALWSLPFMSSYSATKAALKSVSDAARVELSPFNVHVVHVDSGFVKTNIFSNAVAEQVHLPKSSFWAPIKSFMETDIFKTVGIFPVTASSAARQLVRVALQRRPPADAYVGRWIWNTWFCAHFVPYWVLDLFAYYSHGLFKLAGTNTQQQWLQQQRDQDATANGDATNSTSGQEASTAAGRASHDTASGRDQDSSRGPGQQPNSYLAAVALHPAAAKKAA